MEINKVIKYIFILFAAFIVAYFHPEIIAMIIMTILEIGLVYYTYRLIKYFIIKLVTMISNLYKNKLIVVDKEIIIKEK